MRLKNPFAEFNASHMDIEELFKFWIKPSPIFEIQAMGIDLTGHTPVVFMGGRGTGKTMTLKYLSYEFQIKEFLIDHNTDSPIKIDSFWNDHSYIGIYHRFDGPCLSSFARKNVSEEQWGIIFVQYLELVIGQRIIESIINLKENGVLTLTTSDEHTITNQLYYLLYSKTVQNDDSNLKFILDEMQKSVNGIFDFIYEAPLIDSPKFAQRPLYHQNRLIHGISRIFVDHIDQLKNKKFIILLDEYENLMKFQQKIINTSIKHVTSPVTYRIGMRLNGFKTVDTLNSGEFLTEDMDYRKILFEDVMYSNDLKYKQFLKDIANKRLQNFQEYQSNGLVDIEQILGDLSPVQEACLVVYEKIIFDSTIPVDKYIQFRHILKIKQELDKISSLHTKDKSSILKSLIFPQNPLVEMVNLLLIRRGEIDIDEIIRIFNDYKTNQRDSLRYKKFVELYTKNEVALLFQLISIYRPTRKMYAGFDTFVRLSSGITRNFLELCYQSFNNMLFYNQEELLKTKFIPFKLQTNAAKTRAEKVLKTVEVIPEYGNEIQNLVLTMGKIFASNYFDPRISEPEITYFEVNKSELSKDAIKTLNSAVQWSVFQEKPPMKGRTITESYLNVYVMNHILAPYFIISYSTRGRLRRFEKGEIEGILFGEDKQREEIVRNRIKYNDESESYQASLGKFQTEGSL